MDENEYRTPRLKPDFIEWVDQFFSRSRGDEERASQIRTRTDLWAKKMVTEARPLRNFLRQNVNYCADDGSIEMSNEATSYDASINSNGTSRLLEITSTEDAASAFTRSHIQTHGHGPGETHLVESSQDLARWRRSGSPEVSGVVMRAQELIDREVERIVERLLQKTANGNYASGTILLVHSDSTSLEDVDDQELLELIDGHLEERFGAPFGEIHIVSPWRTIQLR